MPRASLYRLIQDGRLDHQRLGQRILIPEQALWEFLERCQRGERY